jgi:hypothetical protein
MNGQADLRPKLIKKVLPFQRPGRSDMKPCSTIWSLPLLCSAVLSRAHSRDSCPGRGSYAS